MNVTGMEAEGDHDYMSLRLSFDTTGPVLSKGVCYQVNPLFECTV